MAFTYFFRDMQTLAFIRDVVVPKFAGRAALHIWDAGCATGAEPYSVAIILRDGMNPFAFRRLRIHATDLDQNGQFEPMIRTGVYPLDEVARVPDELRTRYFLPDERPDCVRVVDEIRARVSFQQHDLLTLAAPLDHSVEAVVCKNVLLHFSEPQRCDVLRMFHAALTGGGYLVMEHTQALPADVAPLFEQVVPHARLYRKAG